MSSEVICPICRTLLLEGESACSMCHTPVERPPTLPDLPPPLPRPGPARVPAPPAPPGMTPREVPRQRPVNPLETDAGPVDVPPPSPTVPTAAAEGNELPAELQGRFEQVRLLGKGGMGVVSLCRDRDLNREVAIKLVLMRSERLAQLLRQEAQVLASLEHPNVVRLYDYGQAGGLPFLVMELVKGRTLQARLAAGQVSVVEAVRICRDFTVGVQAAAGRARTGRCAGRRAAKSRLRWSASR